METYTFFTPPPPLKRRFFFPRRCQYKVFSESTIEVVACCCCCCCCTTSTSQRVKYVIYLFVFFFFTTLQPFPRHSYTHRPSSAAPAPSLFPYLPQDYYRIRSSSFSRTLLRRRRRCRRLIHVNTIIHHGLHPITHP